MQRLLPGGTLASHGQTHDIPTLLQQVLTWLVSGYVKMPAICHHQVAYAMLCPGCQLQTSQIRLLFAHSCGITQPCCQAHTECPRYHAHPCMA